MLRGSAVALIATLVVSLRGQSADPDVRQQPFRSNVDVIGMNVTVTDAARRYVTDLDKQYDLTELAKGDCIFAATGVTDGSLLEGVKLKGGKMTTESVVMRASSGTVRWIRGEHRSH